MMSFKKKKANQDPKSDHWVPKPSEKMEAFRSRRNKGDPRHHPHHHLHHHRYHFEE